MNTASRSICALLLVASGCSSDASDAEALRTEVRDSAGISIVENRGDPDAVPVYAELGEADLEIGVVDGDPEYTFTSVVGARMLGDGSVLVAEGRAMELRVFAAAGEHVVSFGGPGGGPGEFGMLSGLAGLDGDTVRVWDSRNRRVTSFLTDGRLLGDRVLNEETFISVRALTRMTDGSFLVESMDFPRGGPPEIFETSAVLRRWDAAEAQVDTLVVLPGQEMRRGEPRSTTGPDGVVRTMILVLSPPIPNTAYSAVAPDAVYTGYNASYRIERRSLSGDLELVVLAPDLELPLDADEIDAVRRFRVEGCDGREDCVANNEELFEVFEPPELRPTFSELRVDAGGELWVAEWQPRPDEVAVWHVFSPDGELLGRVDVPAGLDIHEIGLDYVLGEWRNEFEVPLVRRYPLTRLR